MTRQEGRFERRMGKPQEMWGCKVAKNRKGETKARKRDVIIKRRKERHDMQRTKIQDQGGKEPSCEEGKRPRNERVLRQNDLNRKKVFFFFLMKQKFILLILLVKYLRDRHNLILCSLKSEVEKSHNRLQMLILLSISALF